MINYYQPFLLPFLRRQTYRLPKGIMHTYFVSFEDALWVLLRSNDVPKNSVILVPDFYCIDVVDNIKAHGYRVEFYALDDHFQTTERSLQGAIQTYRPRVLIIFHACGILSTLSGHIDSLLRTNPDLVVIEDAVQRLLHPEKLTVRTLRHYVIDSLRKVSPLPGSFLYRHHDSPAVIPDPAYKEWRYMLVSSAFYVWFRILNSLGTLLHNSRLIIYAHESVLRTHDDLIGDSYGGYAGSALFKRIHRHVDFDKIEKIKEQQAILYDTLLHGLISRYPMWYRISIPKNDLGKLHVYPIGLDHPRLLLMMKYIQSKLHTNGIPLWFKFTDAPWSEKHGVLFLPLGLHIHRKDITRIMEILNAICAALPAASRKA